MHCVPRLELHMITKTFEVFCILSKCFVYYFNLWQSEWSDWIYKHVSFFVNSFNINLLDTAIILGELCRQTRSVVFDIFLLVLIQVKNCFYGSLIVSREYTVHCKCTYMDIYNNEIYKSLTYCQFSHQHLMFLPPSVILI